MAPKQAALILLLPLLSACAGGAAAGTSTQIIPPTGTPTLTLTAALNGAQVVSFADASPSVPVFYTLDGSTPTIASLRYIAPLMLTTPTTVKAVEQLHGVVSPVTTQLVSAAVPANTLVFDEEFTNTTGSIQQPNPAVWAYDEGHGSQGWGNSELEFYCAWASANPPCTSASPNVFVGTDSALHLVARQPTPGVYTSARIKSQGQLSFLYGRIEARIQIPEGQGIWPAWWMLGNNYVTDNWPLCGEFDLMEHVNQPTPDLVWGSTHMLGGQASHSFSGTGPGTGATANFSATTWHTYGMVWSKGQVTYYVDSPSNVYAISTAANMTQSGATWPFDSGNGMFLLLNVAVGGSWPGSPNASTPYPAEMLVDWIHVYTN
jgi:beta-glucanase (GH16 family)